MVDRPTDQRAATDPAQQLGQNTITELVIRIGLRSGGHCGPSCFCGFGPVQSLFERDQARILRAKFRIAAIPRHLRHPPETGPETPDSAREKRPENSGDP